MIHIAFLRPIDQIFGKQRLLHELQQCLTSNDYQHLRLAVAFAKGGASLRLLPYLKEWRHKRKTIESIIGIDHFVTTKQALEQALGSFDKTYVTHVETKSHLNITFHPKFISSMETIMQFVSMARII